MALFQAEEYLERIRNTKKRMTDAGIDVLIVSDPANMNYLTGYDGWSFYVPQAVVVPQNMPARNCVAVAGIDDGLDIEIEVIAAVV